MMRCWEPCDLDTEHEARLTSEPNDRSMGKVWLGLVTGPLDFFLLTDLERAGVDLCVSRKQGGWGEVMTSFIEDFRVAWIIYYYQQSLTHPLCDVKERGPHEVKNRLRRAINVRLGL